MQSKRLIGLNTILAVSGAAFVAQLGYLYLGSASAPPIRPRPAPEARSAARPLPESARPEPRQELASYGAIAAKNLFSPTRSEVVPTPAGVVAGAVSPPAPPAPKPVLHGVVIGDTAVAYLEEPASRRVAGYRVGDSIAGGTLQSIAFDRVILSRSDGPLEVKLKDPSKPRPAVAEGPGALRPGAAPGAPDPAATLQPGAPAPAPGVQVPIVPGAPAPPGVIRRLPRPLVGRDAPPRQ
jgi:hypothetical protein